MYVKINIVETDTEGSETGRTFDGEIEKYIHDALQQSLRVGEVEFPYVQIIDDHLCLYVIKKDIEQENYHGILIKKFDNQETPGIEEKNIFLYAISNNGSILNSYRHLYDILIYNIPYLIETSRRASRPGAREIKLIDIMKDLIFFYKMNPEKIERLKDNSIKVLDYLRENEIVLENLTLIRTIEDLKSQIDGLSGQVLGQLKYTKRTKKRRTKRRRTKRRRTKRRRSKKRRTKRRTKKRRNLHNEIDTDSS